MLMNMTGGYQLTIIEDEQVALAGGIPMMGSNFFLLTMLSVLVVAVIAGLVSYIIRMNYYRNCLEDLNQRVHPGRTSDSSWSIRSMKAQIAAMEIDIAGMDVEQFVK